MVSRFCLASRQNPLPSSNKNTCRWLIRDSSRSLSANFSLGCKPKNSNTYGSRIIPAGIDGSACLLVSRINPFLLVDKTCSLIQQATHLPLKFFNGPVTLDCLSFIERSFQRIFLSCQLNNMSER